MQKARDSLAADRLMRESTLAADLVLVRWLPVADLAETEVVRLAGLLDAEERARADRFHFDRDRRAFVAAHALARSLLSGAVEGAVAPQDWRFATGLHGKPEVVCPPPLPCLRLNLSHTCGMAAVAVALAHDVGVDVEWLGRRPPSLDLAEGLFSPGEAAAIRAAPAAARTEAFLSFWTLKEAVIKAVGTGLAQPLDTFAFSLRDDEAQDLRFLDGSDDARHWLVHRFRPGPDHLGALAVRCSDPARLKVSATSLAASHLPGSVPG